MNRTIKEATVRRYHDDSHDQLRRHLGDFVNAYNFGRRRKTLRGFTPYEFICTAWASEPERFTLNPNHKTPGLKSWIGDTRRLVDHNPAMLRRRNRPCRLTHLEKTGLVTGATRCND